MGNNFDITELQNKLNEAKNVLILITGNPSIDHVASGLALYLICQKIGKNAGIACSTPMTVGFNRLIGIDKITDKIGNKNLIISFNYDLIEKVTSNVENSKLNLVIEPKPTVGALTQDMAVFSSSGMAAEIIIVIGATSLTDLGKFYSGQESFFNEKLVINIDNKANNNNFGKLNLVNSQFSSCAEIVIRLIKELKFPIDGDIATNLFGAIKANTANFGAPNVNANSFEAAAWCLKQGAQKEQLLTEVKTEPIGLTNNFVPPPSFSPGPFQPENKESQPPPDWFKPKIFKGKSLT